MEFKDQVVLITGGSTGLGFAIASAFGEQGARVAISDLPGDRLAHAIGLLEERDIECLGVEADVRDRDAIDRMSARVADRLGGIDIFVANAGIYPVSAFLETSDEEWEQVIDTNLTGAFRTCQSVARHMVSRGSGGVIITMASGAANHAITGWAHYCTSKAGLVMLTRAMANELAQHRIRVNSVLPGYIDVEEGGRHLSDRFKTTARETIPLGRAGTPRDVAETVLLLASSKAGFVTGAALPVDGGASAGRNIRLPTEE